MKKKFGSFVSGFTVIALGLSISGCGSSGGNGSNSSSTFSVSGSFSGTVSQHITPQFTHNGRTVTHVIAVSPENHEQRLGSVTTSNFSIDISYDRPWIIVFADDTRVGTDMIVGKFRSGVLDTLLPSVGESTMSLGEVTFEEDSPTASASVVPTLSFSDVLARLSMSSSDAAFFGSMDDVCLRYANPDINNNGELDISEGLTDIYLDFHNRFTPQVDGEDVTLTDIQNAYLPTTTDFSYFQTGIMFEIAEDAFSEPSSVEFQFSETVVLGSYNGIGGGETLPANTYHELSYDGTRVHGRYQFDFECIQPPSGTCNIRIGSDVFTFNNIISTQMDVRDGFLLPFLRINTSEENILESVSYKWMKKQGSTWVNASLSEITLAVTASGGTASFRIDQDDEKTIYFTLPITAQSGTITASEAERQNVTLEDVQTMAFDRLGHLGLSYDDTLGMRYFAF